MKLTRTSGILLHITSLYSDYGIGDLGKGAYQFVDFLKEAHQTIWQILPINPTGFGDSPYQSFSTFAGNPLMICPEKLVEWGLLKADDLKSHPFFPMNQVDYGQVITFKEGLNRKAYHRFVQLDNELTACYHQFVAHHDDWLGDYSLFMSLKSHFIDVRRQTEDEKDYAAFVDLHQNVLTEDQMRDYYDGAVWQSWPAPIAKREESAVCEWKKKLSDEIAYHNFLQFIFNKQFKALKGYANQKGVKIIGDMPIFVALDSADCWANPSLFMLDGSGNPTSVAGVPPDYFSEAGQLWGNPLYNWDQLQKSNYHWWIKRIQKALVFCDILRIDHFRGFESYWQVTYGAKTAKKGRWMTGPGKVFFQAVKDQLGDLPIIAEDLGIITPGVEKLRDDLSLPGMKVIQFGFDGKQHNTHLPHHFKTDNIVVYTGTHDNDTTVGWYELSSAEVQDQFRRYLNVSGEDVAWDMIRLAFLSVAKMAIIPMQDVLRLNQDHRMNTPGVTAGNWGFRLSQDCLTKGMAHQLKYLSLLADRNTTFWHSLQAR
ncbi:MAG: 4-alpha-glucanotransferase [Defluviitaleaceae bacterium]|nr:4-alpha-glucanotransferase [Defluviitaleaceae bacterium]